MMVAPPERVECSAKIAMAALFDAPPTKRLLPDWDRTRSIFPHVQAAQLLIIN
jgi:hypothetical protein